MKKSSEIDVLLKEAKRSYCTACDNKDMRIVLTLRIRCAECGHTRMIQRKIEPEYGR